MPWAIVVLELAGDRIAGWNSFLDTEALFPHFGLAMRLEQGLISFSFTVVKLVSQFIYKIINTVFLN